ncbi:hypothetical protein HPB48_012727 [Haemaphysalis longicornis]|uniref:Serine palmitoyltransferase 1 n=1 Tax=Haemaphysalis longicornis TaxID=44386 RepID=A0A9J6FTK4_HAELO|nr:hypothetical protein HPB48_012727 [Haemaphysalis longicornis]
MGVEEACLYSFGFSTIASAIPSYAKLGDIIFACVWRTVTAYEIGDISRRSPGNTPEIVCTVKVFQYCSPRARVTRRFLVVEGIYANRGDIYPLPELVKLRRKFKLRLFIDETCSFAVLGRTGRGVREHFDVPVPAYHLAFQALLFLLASAVWLLFRKSPQASAQKSELTEEGLVFSTIFGLTARVAEEVVVDGHSILNLASHDYLGMAELQGAEKAAIRGHRRYAVGSDEDVNYAIHMGLLASGSKIYYFRHNDVQDLQRLLLEQQARDIADPKKAGITNRFLVVEGIYASRGDICPLPELVNLRRKFQLRLFIDETCSFAVLGHTGRGVREHFNVPSNEIDLMCATLEHGVGAFGGFFCGTRVVVHDQAWEAGLALTRAPYLEDRENTPKDASIRISVSASLTEEDIEHACDVIRRVCEAVVEDA